MLICAKQIILALPVVVRSNPEFRASQIDHFYIFDHNTRYGGYY